MESQLTVEVRPQPTTLSGWIRAAIEDAQRLRDLPNFVLDMSVWNTLRFSSGHKVCAVCLAGAALVGRGLQIPGEAVLTNKVPNHTIMQGHHEVDLESMLNAVRQGYVVHAAIRWGGYLLEDKVSIEAIRIGDEINRQARDDQEIAGLAPWHLYLELAGALEACGL